MIEKRIVLVLMFTVFMVIFNGNLTQAEEESATPLTQPTVFDSVLEEATSEETPSAQESAATPEQASVVSDSDTQWQWLMGKVVAVDTVNMSLIVRYPDYDTESEKDITIAVDDKTIYSNIKSLADLKVEDNVSIDYVVNPDGTNIAKNINVEKIDSISELEEGVVTEEEGAPLQEPKVVE